MTDADVDALQAAHASHEAVAHYCYVDEDHVFYCSVCGGKAHELLADDVTETSKAYPEQTMFEEYAQGYFDCQRDIFRKQRMERST